MVDVIVHVISHDFEDTGQMQGPLFFFNVHRF